MYIQSILAYFKNANHIIKKEDVVKVLGFIFNSISNEILPTFELLAVNKDLKKIEKNKYIGILGKACDIKAKNNADVLLKLKASFDTILKNQKALESLVTKELSDVLTDRALVARDAAIVRVVNDIGAMSLYILSFLDLALLDESKTNYSKMKMSKVRDSIADFSDTYVIYGESKEYEKLLKDLSSVSDSTIDITANNDIGMLTVMLTKAGSNIVLPSASGFINNPIYHVRMWYVDKEIRKYESLKDSKKLIELRLRELQLEEAQTGDPKLREHIEYYEDRIAGIEYDIAKIENSK